MADAAISVVSGFALGNHFVGSVGLGDFHRRRFDLRKVRHFRQRRVAADAIDEQTRVVGGKVRSRHRRTGALFGQGRRTDQLGDVLLVPDHESRRRRHDARLSQGRPQLLAGGVVKGSQFAGAIALEHQAARRRQYAAGARAARMHHAPDFLLRHRIPGLEQGGVYRRIGQAEHESDAAAEINSGIPSFRIDNELGVADIAEEILGNRDVNEIGPLTEGHRIPVVPAKGTGHHQGRLAGAVVTRFGILDRAAGFRIDMARPVDRGVRFAGDELASGRVEHVEKTVLRRLHHHAALFAGDFQVREHDVLGRGVIPGFSRHGLVVPGVAAVVRVQRDDGGEEEVVAAAGAAQGLVPGRTVADADVQQVEFGVVGHGVPYGAAAAEVPPFTGPGVCGRGHHVAFVAISRVAGDGIEAPGLLAAVGVIGGHVAAHAVFRAAVADHDHALDDPRRAGDRIRQGGIRSHRFPFQAAVARIDRHQAPVDSADEHLAVPHRDAAIHHVATGVAAFFAVDLRIVFPELFAAFDVEGVNHAPGGRDVQRAVDHDGRGLLAAAGVDLGVPGQAKLIDVVLVDEIERAVALLVIGPAIGHPGAGFGVRSDEPRLVHRSSVILGQSRCGQDHAGKQGRGPELQISQCGISHLGVCLHSENRILPRRKGLAGKYCHNCKPESNSGR